MAESSKGSSKGNAGDENKGAASGDGDDRPAEKGEKGVDQATDQVQEVVDQETEQGFRGVEVDQTPNENYTVKGVTENPEGVPEAQADPVAARREAAGS